VYAFLKLDPNMYLIVIITAIVAITIQRIVTFCFFVHLINTLTYLLTNNDSNNKSINIITFWHNKELLIMTSVVKLDF